MADLSFAGLGISGIAAAVPAQVIDNLAPHQTFSPEEVAAIVDKIGIRARRVAPLAITAADLAAAAAEQLLGDMSVRRDEIDFLIFVSQTPDYRMPASAILLQHRLGLGMDTIAFDLQLGCSGFVYGLSVGYSLLANTRLRSGLLLVGETRSRVYSSKDRTTAFLFGDGGAAALLTKDPAYGSSEFSLCSDGSRGDLIKIEAGGYRQMSSQATLQEQVVDQSGNIRSAEHGYLKGAEVFNFVLQDVPKNVRHTMKMAEVTHDDVDFFLLHQANAFMNSHLMRKLKLPPERVPQTFEYFGNTSSVSIPLTMVALLQGQLDHRTLLLSGFGVGLSWGSAVIRTSDCWISKLIEVN